MNTAEVEPKELVTVGEIARRLGVGVFRVQYVLRTRGIQPHARAGRLGVYDDDAVRAVRAAIDAMHR